MTLVQINSEVDYNRLKERLNNVLENADNAKEKEYAHQAAKLCDEDRKSLKQYVVSSQFNPFFNVNNHAKLIGTENIVYIGSANYSNESAYSIEAGVLIDDKDFIKKLYAKFFDNVRGDSLSYFEENFSAFQFFVLSLYTKFKYHHKKMLENLYTDYMRTKMVVSDTILMDVSDLESLYRDLDELEFVCGAADDTYDEKNKDYNISLEELKKML